MSTATFFKHYPTKQLKQDGVFKNIVDLSRYVRVSNDLLVENYEYFDYVIVGSDRPDQVAYTIYGDSKYYWSILVSNNIRNIWTQWPLGQNEFDRYIVSKYTSVDTAQSQTYRNIALKDIFKASTASLPELIIATGEPVDSAAITNYSLTVGVDYEIVTNYRREYDLNEAKRNIKLVQRSNLEAMMKELSSLFGV